MATTSLRLPADEYTGAPKETFLGEEWHERDLEAIFRPRWLIAGHVDELDGGGSGHGYITYSLGREEILIRRDEEGVVRGFHNFCPHRGAQLCESGHGAMSSKRIVCPYHAWTFSASDGSLLSARHMHEDFDSQALPLKPVHVEEWKGLIFVCLGDEAPLPVAELFEEISFEGYEVERMKLATVKSHDIEANWKIVVENNLECYHCTVIHPELSAEMDWKLFATEDFEGHIAERAEGLELMHGDKTPWDFNRELSRLTRTTIGGKRVCAIPSPREDDVVDPPGAGMIWEPGLALSISRDHGWIFVPKPINSHRTELRQYWLVAPDAEEGRDYELDDLMRFWDVTMVQDRDVCQRVQRGMDMPAYEPGPLNRIYQTGQAGFYAWYMAQIEKHFPALAEQALAGGD